MENTCDLPPNAHWSRVFPAPGTLSSSAMRLIRVFAAQTPKESGIFSSDVGLATISSVFIPMVSPP
jgi:hypothetical protein